MTSKIKKRVAAWQAFRREFEEVGTRVKKRNEGGRGRGEKETSSSSYSFSLRPFSRLHLFLPPIFAQYLTPSETTGDLGPRLKRP